MDYILATSSISPLVGIFSNSCHPLFKLISVAHFLSGELLSIYVEPLIR